MSSVVTARQLPLDLTPAEPGGLDEYLPGPNEEAFTWLQAWPHGHAAAGVGRGTAYLWGPSGAGKTHLLRGLACRALALRWHVLRLAPEGFQSWESSDGAPGTLVLIDGCDALDVQQQHWAFSLFIEQAAVAAARQAGEGGDMQIVAAGRLPPVDLPVRDDLRTRLGWGLVFALHPLPEADVEAALGQEAARRGLRLADGVLPYLMTRFSRDLGVLMALLDRLDRYALAEQRLVTVPLLKQMLAQEME